MFSLKTGMDGERPGPWVVSVECLNMPLLPLASKRVFVEFFNVKMSLICTKMIVEVKHFHKNGFSRRPVFTEMVEFDPFIEKNKMSETVA